MTRTVAGLLVIVGLGGCRSAPARPDDGPVAVHTVELPPEVAGTDPHRQGGPLDLTPPSDQIALPDGGFASPPPASPPLLPGYMESPPPGPAGAQRQDPWGY